MPTPPDPQGTPIPGTPAIYQAVESHQQAIANLDKQTAKTLVSAYDRAFSGVQAKLDKLTDTMVEAGKNGQPINPGWLLMQDRYTSLIEQIDREMDLFGQVAAGEITGAQAKAALMASQHAQEAVMAALGENAGIVGLWDRLPREAFRDLVGFTGSGSPLRALFDQFGLQASQNARTALLQGVAAGEHPTVMARKLKDALGTTGSRALLIARTENHRAYREATRREYVNSKTVKGWVWLCSLSRRTCAACFAMHGSLHSADERMGSHPACRCMMIPRVASWSEMGFQDIPDTQVKIPSGEWYFKNKLTDADRLAILGPGKFDAYKQGEIKLRDLVRTRNSSQWGTSRTVASLKDAKENHLQAPGKQPVVLPKKPLAEMPGGKAKLQYPEAIGPQRPAPLPYKEPIGPVQPAPLKARPGSVATINNGIHAGKQGVIVGTNPTGSVNVKLPSGGIVKINPNNLTTLTKASKTDLGPAIPEGWTPKPALKPRAGSVVQSPWGKGTITGKIGDNWTVKLDSGGTAHLLDTDLTVLTKASKNPLGPAVPRLPHPINDKPPFDLKSLVKAEGEQISAGVHAKTVYRAPDGSLWMHKPVNGGERFRADLDVILSKVAQKAGLDAPDTYVAEIDGKVGSLQKLWGGAAQRRDAFRGDIDVTKLDAKDMLQLQKHAAYDWLVANHDGHAGQYVKVSGTGGKIFGIDKGAAFKFFGADKLDYRYEPQAIGGTVANKIAKAYAEGKNLAGFNLAKNPGEFRSFLEGMRDIADDEYRELLRPYAEGASRAGLLARNAPAAIRGNVDAFLDAAVARKNTLLDDWTAYEDRLEEARRAALGIQPPGNIPSWSKGWGEGARKWTSNTQGEKWADDTFGPDKANITDAERRAFREYQGAGYGPWNAGLRGQRPLSPTHQQMTKTVDKAMERTVIPEDIHLVRGVDANALLGRTAEQWVGGEYFDDAYMSTTPGTVPGGSFKYKPIYLRIHAKAGTPAFWVDNLNKMGEQELLLSRGQRYYVHRVYQEGGKTILELEMDPTPRPK